MNDTSPEIAAMIRARLVAKTGEEQFLKGIRMHEAARSELTLTTSVPYQSGSHKYQV